MASNVSSDKGGVMAQKRSFGAISKGDSSDSDDDEKKHRKFGNFPSGRMSDSSCDVEGESEGETFRKWSDSHPRKRMTKMKIIKKPQNEDDVFYNDFAMMHNEGPDIYRDDWGEEAFSEKSSTSSNSSNDESSSSDSSDTSGDKSESSAESTDGSSDKNCAAGQDNANKEPSNGSSSNAGGNDGNAGTERQSGHGGETEMGVATPPFKDTTVSPNVVHALDRQLDIIGEDFRRRREKFDNFIQNDMPEVAPLLNDQYDDPYNYYRDLETIKFPPPVDGVSFNERWDSWTRQCKIRRHELKLKRIDASINAVINSGKKSESSISYPGDDDNVAGPSKKK